MIFENCPDFIAHLSKLHAIFNLLALDVGSKKIGIASGNSLTRFATPLKVVAHDVGAVQKFIKEYDIHGLIVGIPSKKDSSSFKMIVKFANELSDKLKIPITFEDETYTTAMANSLLKEVGLNRKKRNEIDDMIAAQIILDSFFKKLP